MSFTTVAEKPAVPQAVKWELVFFKVEETIFGLPRHRFTEHSEVFADMFLMPPGGDQSIEGRDSAHPITLEGYKATDFDALIKILYPTPEDLISGALNLAKEEWVGILNLSTRWQMKKIRQHAIDKLSALGLDGLEKVILARTHKVAKWLREGLNEIVSENPISRSPDELESQLGLRTAYRVLLIRDRGHSKASSWGGGYVTLGGLGCPYCGDEFIEKDMTCPSCSRNLGLHDRDAVWCSGGVSGSASCDNQIPSKVTVTVVFNTGYLYCKACGNCPLTGYATCCSCSRSVHTGNLRLISQRTVFPHLETQINETFADEIAEYESWDG